jgi:predicted ester cyclase
MALVRRFWEEVWNQGKLELLDGLFAPDLVAGRKSFIGKTLHAFANSHVTIDDLIAVDDKVITRYTWRAIHREVWDESLAGVSMAVPPTGQAVWDRGIAIHRIVDGIIVEGWSEWTKLELAVQLGAIK